MTINNFTMNAIEAVSRTVKTMADGTLRLTVDISPIHAQNAFRMFGSPDVPVALARLTTEAATASAQQETIAHGERLTGLALLAVQWCSDPNFWAWLNTQNTHDDLVIAKSEKDASAIIKTWCGIESRKELNINADAAAIFNQDIRGPYMQWIQNGYR